MSAAAPRARPVQANALEPDLPRRGIVQRLSGSPVIHRYDPIFEDARPQPFLEKANDASVADP